MKSSNALIIASLVLAILGIIILFSCQHYKRKGKQVLTVRKMTFFSVMLAIAIAVSFLKI
jgi:cell division protein FtsW (lipid II flippase)